MRIKVLVFTNCNTGIYSRARHDFHYCPCGSISIDGGFEYCRIGSKDLNSIVWKEVEVNATKQDLFEDWNKSKDKYGIIKDIEEEP